MSKMIEIEGLQFIQGTARCPHKVPGSRGRSKMCGRQFRYILPLTLVVSYAEDGRKALGCTDHAKWIQLNEARYEHYMRLEQLAPGVLVRTK